VRDFFETRKLVEGRDEIVNEIKIIEVLLQLKTSSPFINHHKSQLAFVAQQNLHQPYHFKI
jgi:hypothetical protein